MELYIFYDCDEWKSNESMRFICVVNEDAYEDAYEEIKKNRDYNDEDMEKYIFIENTMLNDYLEV